jgi:hypothetical protein
VTEPELILGGSTTLVSTLLNASHRIAFSPYFKTTTWIRFVGIDASLRSA